MKVLIVGNNVAGTNLAKALRDSDHAVEIEVFTDERMPYYARPKLIEYVSGQVAEEALPFYPLDWYAQNKITLHLGSRVDRVELAEKRIIVNGAAHAYDKLAIATGSSSFIPPLKGLPKKGVFALRTVEDARNIRAAAAAGQSAVVIGGGLLGIEAARAVCTGFPHIRVTILEFAEHLLMRQLDHEGADILQRWIEETGVKVLLKAETEEVLGADRAEGVRLKDGRSVQGDMVIISAGTRSNVSLAKTAGLKVNKGIVVDSSLRTSDPDVYALGDASEFGGMVWAMIPPALEQVKIAARKMLGLEGPEYKGAIPSNTLKVAGVDLTSVGAVRSQHEPPDPGFEEIRAVSPDGKVYKKFVVKDDRLIGAILFGTKKDVNKVTKLVKEGQPIGLLKQSLSDPDFVFP